MPSATKQDDWYTQVWIVKKTLVAKNQNKQKNKRKWRLRSSTFIWHMFHWVQKSMSAKKATLKDESRLVCGMNQLWLIVIKILLRFNVQKFEWLYFIPFTNSSTFDTQFPWVSRLSTFSITFYKKEGCICSSQLTWKETNFLSTC